MDEPKTIIQQTFTPVDEPEPAPAQPVIAPPAHVPEQDIDERRLEKSLDFILSNPRALEIAAERLGINAIQREAATARALQHFGLSEADADIIQANTPAEIMAKAEKLAARLQTASGKTNTPPPPEIKLPERQFMTEQERIMAQAEYDMKYNPEIQRLKASLPGARR